MAKISRKTELSIKESEVIYTYLLVNGLKFQDTSTINIEELKKS